MFVISGIRERSGCSLQDVERRTSARTQSLSHHGPDDDVWSSHCAFGGEPPMRILTISNAHPRTYGHIYSKVAELLFILRSHQPRGVRCEFSR